MTKNKILLIFFALVFGFFSFADCETDKANCLAYLASSTQQVYYIVNTASDISYIANTHLEYGSSAQNIIDSDAQNILQKSTALNGYLGSIRAIVESVDCSATNSAGICPDLSPIVTLLQHIDYSLDSVRSNVLSIKSTVQSISSELTYGFNLLNGTQTEIVFALSNLNYNVSIGANSISNELSLLRSDLSNIDNNFSLFYSEWSSLIWEFFYNLIDIAASVNVLSTSVQDIKSQLLSYLPYLKTLSDDLKLISTNGTYNIDQSYTNQLYYSSLLGFDRFRYYAQGQLNNTQPSLYPLSPYDSLQHLRNATIYDAISSGFTSLLISQGSINNYLYWLKAIAGSNRLEAVEAHLVAVSNLVGRLDDYVLGDFSNEVSRLVETLSYVTNSVDYTTNFVHLAELVETNNTFLSSIDSKLDVLDYIKILSDTPLSDYSGDGDYYDYLTNLYINGSADSGVASTNWFERMEILLASLVFGDSGGSSISNEVEFTNFSEETIENAFNDYTFQNELTSGISLVEDTGENFLTILRGFHNSLSSISQPQSIAIGIGGLDGQDTLTYQDVMHHHFQVSFNSGASDNFTLIVRSMTTIIWILVTMMFVYFSARWLLSKVLFFYRLMRTLITSLFLK